MTTQYVLPEASRRVKLLFDKNGDPAYPSVTHPECSKQNALGVLPPRDVIPIVFVPGIMGTNLNPIQTPEDKLKGKKVKPAWMPPNTTKERLGAVAKAIRLSPAQRQRFFDPDNTEVNEAGPCQVPDHVYWLDTAEATRRGWGALHADSYLATLLRLEESLNDRYTMPGRKEKEGNYWLPEIGMLQYLDGGPMPPCPPTGPGYLDASALPGDEPMPSCPPEKVRANYAALATRALNIWRQEADHHASGVNDPVPTGEIFHDGPAMHHGSGVGNPVPTGEITPKASPSRPIFKGVNSMSAEEIARLDDYYFPVWAYGYNWLRCNSESAEGLKKFIEERVLPRYQGNYFRHQGKVILVTHSMGGLVARRAAQLFPEKILGVVQSVCPLTGAPVVYRRFRAGTEYTWFSLTERGAAKVLGDDAAAVTPELACAPGALELAPSQFYPKGWLRFTQKKPFGGQANEFAALPKEDPYEEIYMKTTDECWWGMLDPDLIDPAGLIADRNEADKAKAEADEAEADEADEADEVPEKDLSARNAALKKARKAIRKAKKFHTTIGHYAHPNTYGFYANDDKKYRAFGHVTWETSYTGTLPATDDLLARKDLNRSLDGKSWVSSGEEARVAGPAPYPDAIQTLDHGTIRFKVLNDKDQAGDGTVPRDSGAFLLDLKPMMALAIPGYAHANPFEYDPAYHATIYGIARIVQKAAPAEPYC